MRILQVVQKPQRRGAEIFAFQLSEELRRRGQEVRTVYLYPYEGDKALPTQAHDCLLAGQECHPLEKIPGFHPSLLKQLQRLIEDFEPDVVQVNGARTVKYGAFVKKFSYRKKWRLIYRNIDDPKYWVTDPLRRWFYKKLVMPYVDGVIGVSETTLCNVEAMYALQVPTIYIPNGIDLAPLQSFSSQEKARQKIGISQDIAVVLFIGNLTAQKRPDRFLRVIRRVYENRTNVEGWILGDGPLLESLKNEVRSLQIDHIVRFWSYQEEIGLFIGASDLLLVTSDSDGIPAVILEAGFLGKPTVASCVGGIPECVLNGKTGLLVNPLDEKAMARAVLSLLQHPKQRLEIGIQAQKWIQNNYAIDKIAQRYLSFYEEVLTRPHKIRWGQF